jgi:GNAT superfamily N-acetyltransferase
MTTTRGPRARFTYRPLTPGRWADLERLFGARGACGNCWCMAWRLPPRLWRAGKTGGNRRAFRALVERGPAPGILAYHEGEPVGWCSLAPRGSFAALASSRVLAPVDDAPVWSITCFFVARPFRRHGLTAGLLEAAAAWAARRGARVLEGYPQEPRMEKMPDVFAWTGVASAFRRAGFSEVTRRSASRPIMRRLISAAAPAPGRAARRAGAARRPGPGTRSAATRRPRRPRGSGRRPPRR